MSFVQNAATLVVGQLITKLFTFSLNQLLLSYTSPNALGISQLIEFVIDYNLFLSREALRLTIPKLPNDESKRQFVINYSYASIPLLLVFGGPVIYWKIGKIDNEALEFLSPLGINHILLMIFLSLVLELLAEPYYNVNQHIMLDFKTRTRIETTSGFIKCIIQFISTIKITPLMGMQRGDVNSYVLGYLMGQLSSSLSLYVLYLIHFRQLMKPSVVEDSFTESITTKYFKSIFVQQIFKNFLTVGDKFVITSLLNFETQGYYSFISNYGSLIARMLFAPIEESTRITVNTFFKSNKDKRSDFLLFQGCVSNVLKIYVYLLTLLIIFAPLNTNFLLSLVFKNFITDSSVITFKWYWVYLLFLACNGILEALYQSLFASKEMVNKYSAFMLMNSIMFLTTLTVFISKFDLGLQGLIWGNMINMSFRIGYCFYYVIQFIKFKENSLKVHFDVGFASYVPFLTAAGMLTLFQYLYFHGEVQSFRQFIISGVCGIFLVLIAVVAEYQAKKKKSKND